jgi:hypothetical protein
MKEISKWFNAIGNAWNDGWAPWAYVDGQSVAVKVWNEGGDVAVIALARSNGVTLKRRRGCS